MENLFLAERLTLITGEYQYDPDYGKVCWPFTDFSPKENKWVGQGHDKYGALVFLGSDNWLFYHTKDTTVSKHIENSSLWEHLLTEDPDKDQCYINLPDSIRRLLFRFVSNLGLAENSFPLQKGKPLAKKPIFLERLWSLGLSIALCAEECTASKAMTVIIHEAEIFLTPLLQRRLLPALLNFFPQKPKLPLQLIVTTNSPLVLASMDVEFDPNKDLWYKISKSKFLQAEEQNFVALESIDLWLTYQWGFNHPVSYETETALQEGYALANSPQKPSLAVIKKLDKQLRAVLSSTNQFWWKWDMYVMQHYPELKL